MLLSHYRRRCLALQASSPLVHRSNSFLESLPRQNTSLWLQNFCQKCSITLWYLCNTLLNAMLHGIWKLVVLNAWGLWFLMFFSAQWHCLIRLHGLMETASSCFDPDKKVFKSFPQRHTILPDFFCQRSSWILDSAPYLKLEACPWTLVARQRCANKNVFVEVVNGC